MRNTLRPKLVICGIDGVLYDGSLVMRQSLHQTANSIGVVLDPSKSDVRQALYANRGVLRPNAVPSFLAGEDPHWLQAQKEGFGTAIWGTLNESQLSRMALPGARQFLANMPPSGLVLISDSGLEVTQASLRRYSAEVRPNLEVRHVGINTSGAERLQMIAGLHGISPSDCLVIKASDRGVAAALQAGMPVIALQTLGNSLWKADPNLIVARDLSSVHVATSGTNMQVICTSARSVHTRGGIDRSFGRRERDLSR